MAQARQIMECILTAVANRCLAVYDFQWILVSVSALPEAAGFEGAESYGLLWQENHPDYDTVSGSSVDFHGTGIYSGWKGTGAAFVADRWIWAFLVYAGYYEIFPDCTAVLAVAADDKE